MRLQFDQRHGCFLQLLCTALLALLASCGGSGDEAAAAIPAQGGSADIGPTGGSGSATFEGGASVTISPAGLQFAVPATLSVVLPSGADTGSKLVSFGVGSVRVPIDPVDTATRTMTVDLLYFGVGAAAPASLSLNASDRRETIASARARPADAATETTLELFVQNGDLTSAVTLQATARC